MLAIPYFLTSTVRDLLRLPQPRPVLVDHPEQQQIKKGQELQERTLQSVQPATAQMVKTTQQQQHGQQQRGQLQQQIGSVKKSPLFVRKQRQQVHPQQQQQPNQHQHQQQQQLRPGAAPSPNSKTPDRSPRSSPLLTSRKTLVLAPPAPATKMSAEWAQSQVETFKFEFDKADKDKNASLSFTEVYDVLKSVGFKGSEAEAKAIFAFLDMNKDSRISRSEFESAMNNLPRISIKEFVLRKAFVSLDKDGSGFLSYDEIVEATKKSGGIDIAADKISDLLVFLCQENKEKICYEDFLFVLGVEGTASNMRRVFAELDADKSGFLSRDEIINGVTSDPELKLTATRISDLLIYQVKDADGKVNYEEFVGVWLQQKDEKKK